MIRIVRAGLAVGRPGMALAMLLAIAWLPEGILAAPGAPVTAADRTDAMAARVSVTDVQQFACPCRLWTESDVPVWASFPDPGPVELGVKFRSSVPGVILGIRFYKGPQNVSAHSGSLWTADGVQLAIGWFVAESPSGWQEMRFATPVQIQAATTYIASYNTDVGYYAATNAYFDTAVTRGPLTALAHSEGGNGVYRYGIHAFPDQTYQATNYWVDVVFDVAPSSPAPPTPTPTLISPGPTPTPPPPAQGVCSPRPRVVVQVTPAGAGRLRVTLEPSSNPGQQNNPIQAVQLGTLQNAAVDIPVQSGVPSAQNGLSNGSQVNLSGPVPSLQLFVRRVAPGAFTAPLTVTDGCGPWQTLAGGGTDVP
jgi:hypothetical protein